MPPVHNALRRGQFSSALTRAIGDTRGAGGIERYGETLQPVIDLWSKNEWAYLRNEFHFAGSATIAAAVGFNSILYLNNPANSNVIAVIRGAWADGGAAALAGVTITQPATAKTAGNPGNERDTRTPFGGSRCLLESVNTEATPAGQSIGPRLIVPANGPTGRLVEPDDLLILTPGNSFGITAIAVNVLLNATWLWSERIMFPGERERG